MTKDRRNEIYGLIAQVVAENPKLASGSLKRAGSDYESERIRKSMDCEYCNRGWRDGMGALPHQTPCTFCNEDGRVPRSLEYIKPKFGLGKLSPAVNERKGSEMPAESNSAKADQMRRRMAFKALPKSANAKSSDLSD